MVEVYPLLKAPIKEAVIDVRCLTGVKMEPALLKILGAEIGYGGEAQEVNTMSFMVQPTVGAPPIPKVSEQVLVGGRFLSGADRNFVVQMRTDGMTFSRLQPYTKWDEIFPEASRLWAIFCAHMQVKEVSRIAVRYVNRLLLPQPDFSNNPSDFLTPPPPLPNGIREDCKVAQWMSRFVIEGATEDVTATITQLSDTITESPDQYALIFDIDVFTQKDLPINPELLLPRFAQLRALKNDIFFAALTKRTLELFK